MNDTILTDLNTEAAALKDLSSGFAQDLGRLKRAGQKLIDPDRMRSMLSKACRDAGDAGRFAEFNGVSEKHVAKVLAHKTTPCRPLLRALGLRPVTHYRRVGWRMNRMIETAQILIFIWMLAIASVYGGYLRLTAPDHPTPPTKYSTERMPA